MGKKGHTLKPEVMGSLVKLREELQATQDQRDGIKKAVRELHERDRDLAALQYKLEWAIVNTEIANGLRSKPTPHLLDPDGVHFWEGVKKVPFKEKPGQTKRQTKKQFKVDNVKEVEANL